MENGIRHSLKPSIAEFTGTEPAVLLNEITFRDSYRKEGSVVMSAGFIFDKYRYFKTRIDVCLERLKTCGFIDSFEIVGKHIFVTISDDNYKNIDEAAMSYEETVVD